MAIEENNSQLDAQLPDTERSLLQARSENASLSNQLTDVTTAKAEADGQILSLQSSLKQANDEIERLKRLLADMTTAKSAGDARISMLEGQGKVDTDKIASLNERVSELEATLQRTDEGTAVTTVEHTDVTSAGAASMAAADEEIVDLKNQLSALQASSSQSIAQLQSQLIGANDELAALMDKHTKLIALHAVADKQVEALTARAKDDTQEIANQIKRIAELEVKLEESTLAKVNADTQLEAMNRELADLQASSTKIIADWETECKRNVAELASMTKKHADVSASGAAAMAVAEKTIAEWEMTCKNKDLELASLIDQQTNLKASSVAASDEVIETLKSQLSALQISTSKTIADLQAQNRKSNDDMAVVTQKFNDLTAAKASVDKQIEALQIQGKKAADDLIASSSAMMAGNHPQPHHLPYPSHRPLHPLIRYPLSHPLIPPAYIPTFTPFLAHILTEKDEAVSASKAAADEEIMNLKSKMSSLQASYSQSVAVNADLQSQLKNASDELAALTSTSEATKVAIDKQFADVQAQLKNSNDEVTTLTIKNNELSAAKLAADVLVAHATDDKTSADASINQMLEEQSKKDRDEIAELSQQLAAARTKSNDDLAVSTKQHDELNASSAAAKSVGDKVIGVLKKQLANLQSSSETTIANLQAQYNKSNDELTALTMSSEAAKVAVDLQIVDLKNQLSALQTSSTQSIGNLEVQLKKASDEVSALNKKCNDLTAAKVAVDKQVEPLTAQGKDPSEIVAQKNQLDESTAKLTALAKEYQTYKTTSEKTISDLNAASSQLNESIEELQTQFKNAKDEASVLTKECNDLTAAKTTADKRIEILQEAKDAAAGHVMTLEAQKRQEEMTVVDVHQMLEVPSAAETAQETQQPQRPPPRQPHAQAQPQPKPQTQQQPPQQQPQKRPSLDRRASSASSLSLAISSVDDNDSHDDADNGRCNGDNKSDSGSSFRGLANRSREGSLSLAPHSELISMVSGSRAEIHGTLSYSSRQSANSGLGLLQYRGNGRNRLAFQFNLSPIA